MNKNIKQTVFNLIKSFFVAFAWMNIGNLESSSILVICAFIASFILFSYRNAIVETLKKPVALASYILGGLFAILYAFFADLTGGLSNKLFIIVYVFCTVAGLFFMFSELLLIIISKAEKKKINDSPKPFSAKVLFIYAGIIFVCTIPFLALNFPGVMTPDSLSQYKQIIGTEPWINHHPWVHTEIFGFFFNLGSLFTDNVYIAIACYTVFQMLFVSFGVAYCIECMYEFGFNRKVRIALLLCFILLPYNLIYAVTIWKDIIFSIAVLVLTVTLLRISQKFSARDMVLFIVCGILMCLIRHNGFYAFVATGIIFIVFNLITKRKMTRFLICFIAVSLTAILFRSAIPNALGIEPDQFVYNVPIPLQQIGAVVAGDLEITTEEEAFLRNINSLEYIKENYSPQGADAMSVWVLSGNADFFNSNKGDFFKMWWKLGLRYPATYFRAYVEITKGYWAPMQPQQTVFFGITEGYSELSSQPLINGPVQVKINELLYKFHNMIPVYGFMYSMGGFFWVLLVLIAICIVRACNKKDAAKTDSKSVLVASSQIYKILCMVPLIMLTGTLLAATPLVADLRYNYALMITLPYLIFEVLRKDS